MTGNEEILAAMARKDAEQAPNPPVLRQIATGGAGAQGSWPSQDRGSDY